MKYKARIIEIGSDGHHQRVTLNVTNIDDLRAIAAHLYEDAIIQTTPAIDAVLGGSDVCETCDAHCQVLEENRKTIATVISILERHQMSRCTEDLDRSPSVDGCLDRLKGLL